MLERNMPLDYYISISISDDKLSAFLLINNMDDTFKVTAAELEELAQKNRIIHGLNRQLLAQIAANSKSFYQQKVVIAVGTKAEQGANGYISYTFDLDENDKKPQELDDGRVNYKEVVSLNNVKKGQLIGQRFLATEGTPGRAVTGETLFSKAGKEARFKIGKNVIADAEQKALYALIDGMVVKTDRDKVNVFPVYEVNGDVDYHIGNIDFIGTVVVRGNVLPGFKIRAAGDIRITGGVEAAELEADGSIEINAGIVGQNKAFVKAGKNVKSSFIQDATVEVLGELKVSQSIMHSIIRAGKAVNCNGAKGLIVGGTIQAGERVTARTIGNSMSTTTVIEVGVLPELRNEMIHLRSQLRVFMENMDKTEKALLLLDSLAAAGQLTPDKLAMRVKLNHTKRQGIEEQNTIKERILEIEKSLEDSEQAKVEVLSTVYGGTKIVIGRYTKFIKDSTNRMTFRLHEGDISMSAYV
ncbi:FapA family protein [Paenibacillus chondroitinus]|uniref:FapA family protein n=1 Tax=Paenibacillus chondroitinus TaxID=59842 RepID=A0ABU6DIG9_9BACL|nr:MULTISPECIES: FapA family protein [Paenibacillus]MCY9659058.1 FapA family protein [Paenibacillus anseongense]MEB4796607.1 FapA family protein [Paenibacillus chondroitinus]